MSAMLMVSALGFMDDANWITSSLENANKILSIADDFYKLTKSAINKKKTKILTNNKKALNDRNVDLMFGNELISIVPSTESVRFLGVWLNIDLMKSRSFVKNK